MDLNEPSSKATISYLLNSDEPEAQHNQTLLQSSEKTPLSFPRNPADENDANHTPIVETEEEYEVVTEEEDEIVISSPKKGSLSFIVNPLNQASMEKEPLITSPSPLPIEDCDKKYWNAIKRIIIQHGISIEHTKNTLLKHKNLGISTCINNNINQHVIEALHKENMSSKQISLIVNVKEDAVKNYLSQVPVKKHLSSFNISRSRQTANNGPNIIPSQSFEKPISPNDILYEFRYGNTKTGYDPTIQYTYPSKKRKRSEDDKSNSHTLQTSNRAWPKDMLTPPPPKETGKRARNRATPPIIQEARGFISPENWSTIKDVLIMHGLDKRVAEGLEFNGEKPWGTRKGSSDKRKEVMHELIDTYGMSCKEAGTVLGLTESSIQRYRAKSH